MRVIAGTRRSLPLKALEGEETRPTLDRYKETLFNILQNDIPGSRFLDLFAGSGAVGIEALSRGARHAVFVENSRKAQAVIRENVHFTRFEDASDILLSDVLSYLRTLPTVDFDVIYIDPPYRHGLEKDALRILSGKSFRNPETRIVIEAALEEDMGFVEDTIFCIEKIKAYKTNKHVFLRLKEA